VSCARAVQNSVEWFEIGDHRGGHCLNTGHFSDIGSIFFKYNGFVSIELFLLCAQVPVLFAVGTALLLFFNCSPEYGYEFAF